MVIRFEDTTKPTTFLHQIRTFGETLYRAGRNDERCSISIEDIDQATDQLTVNVKSSSPVLKARAMINQLLEEHFLGARTMLSEINEPPT